MERLDFLDLRRPTWNKSISALDELYLAVAAGQILLGQLTQEDGKFLQPAREVGKLKVDDSVSLILPELNCHAGTLTPAFNLACGADST